MTNEMTIATLQQANHMKHEIVSILCFLYPSFINFSIKKLYNSK
jgi:hypothetical protein